MIRNTVLSVLLLAVSATGLHAQVTTYFGDSAATNPRDLTAPNNARNTFLAAFANTGTDTMESYTGYQAPPDPFPPPPVLNNFGGTGVSANTNAFFIGHDPFGFYPVSGNQILVANQFASNTFALSAAVNGFGLFIIQAGDAVTNNFQVSLQLGAGPIRTYPVNASGNGTGSPLDFGPGRVDNSAFFFGIRDTDLFDTVSIVAAVNTGGDGVIYDDVSVGFIAAVPEPTTYALMGCILAGAGGWYARQRKARQQLEAKKLRR